MRRTSQKAPAVERWLMMALYDLVAGLRKEGLALLITHYSVF